MSKLLSIINLILSLVIMGYGVYGIILTDSQDGYWWGALIVGAIWFIWDIVKMKRNAGEE